MALTNFAALTTEQKTAWALDFWHHARNNAFINQFVGSGPNAMIQRITELTRTQKGARAVITLLADLVGDGVMGDTVLENKEEALTSYDTVFKIDQLRNANRRQGRMADQKSIVNFRKASRDALAYWIADRLDQLAFLTLSSLPYTRANNGALRPVLAAGQNFSDLEFAEASPAPSANRCFYLKSTGLTRGTGNSAVEGSLVPMTYKSLVQLKAAAKDSYVRPVKSKAGEDIYHVFVNPMAMADLRLDPDFLANVRGAGVRGEKNELFSGASSVMVDGLIVHEFRHVYDTSGAAGGQKFGASGNTNGQRALLCGAQALGMADIGDAEWVEDTFDYENQLGISVAKTVGFVKTAFKGNPQTPTTKEDFGVITLDTGMSVL